jgi:hypothetical protein
MIQARGHWVNLAPFPVIASAAKQSSAETGAAGLLRRFAPRNDG